MASVLSALLLLLPLQSVANPLGERACSTVSGVYHTFYGYPDNSPQGPDIKYTQCGRKSAGGIVGLPFPSVLKLPST